MAQPHKHEKLIKRWAEGATIQFLDPNRGWRDVVRNTPLWSDFEKYRVKPTPREDKYIVVGYDTHAKEYFLVEGDKGRGLIHDKQGMAYYPLMTLQEAKDSVEELNESWAGEVEYNIFLAKEE